MSNEHTSHKPAPSTVSEPTEALLEAVERTCTTWLEANCEYFDPFPDGGVSLATLSVRRKAFSELGILLYVVDQLGEKRTVPELRVLFGERVNDSRYAELLRRSTDKVLLYASAFATAHASGVLHDDAYAALTATLDEPLVRNAERTPFRSLDLWYVTQLCGRSDPTFDVRNCLSTGCLGTPFDIVAAGTPEIYALTHTVLYYYNFGVASPVFPNAPIPAAFDLENAISGLVLRAIAENDADLVLELLLAGAVSGQLHPKIRDLGLQWVSELSTEGYVPGPRGTACENVSQHESDAFRSWARHYHTNLVAVMTTTVMRHTDHLARELAEREHSSEAVSTDGLLDLGRLLAWLHGYRLGDAAVLLSSLVDTPVSREYADVFDAAVSFLRRQQNSAGTFGFWADERLLFEANGGDPAAFDERFVVPVSDTCRAALTEVEGANRNSRQTTGRPEAVRDDPP